jgi:plasmid stabilization system protein ParE
MSKPIRFRRRAAEEGLAAREWYEAERPGLGNDFGHALQEAFDLIGEHPQSAPVFYRDIRRHRLSRFPYHIYFVDDQDSVVIVAIFHGARSPRSIRRRLRE